MRTLKILTGVKKHFGAASALMFVIVVVNLASTPLMAAEFLWEKLSPFRMRSESRVPLLV